jgi:hypothetical protein
MLERGALPYGSTPVTLTLVRQILPVINDGVRRSMAIPVTGDLVAGCVSWPSHGGGFKLTKTVQNRPFNATA